MKTIKVEKQTGAKRNFRKYIMTNSCDYRPSFDFETVDDTDNVIEFAKDFEAEFIIEVEAFKVEQIKVLSAEARLLNVTGVKEISFKQGSKEWLASRIGIITASKTPFDINGKPIPTFDTYVSSKVADAFIQQNDGEAEVGYTTEQMQIGTDIEHYAIERYEEITGRTVESRSLLTSDRLMIGASPDGVTVDENDNTVNIEVKSVLLKTFISQLSDGKVTETYHTQVQVQMYMLNCDYTDLVVQCQQVSGQPLDIDIVTIERKEEFISNMIETIKLYEAEYKRKYELLSTKIIG